MITAQNMPLTTDRLKGLRWFLGFVFLSAFSFALLSLGAYYLSSEKVTKPMLAKTMNIVFRQDGMKETTRVVNYLNELYKQRESVQAITALNPEKIQSDIASMSPEESQKYLEETVAKPLYENGTKIIEPLKAVNPDAAIEAERLDFLSMANINSNQFLRKTLLYQAIALIIILLLLILMSRGLKKISTPATLIFVASIPGALFFGLFETLADRFIKPILGQYGTGPVYNDLLREVIAPVILTLRNIHLAAAAAGLTLIIVAILLRLIFRPTSKAVMPVQA